MITKEKPAYKWCPCCRKWYGPEKRAYSKWLYSKYCSRDCASLMNHGIHSKEPDPTPEEIAERTKQIRAQWGAGESGDVTLPPGYSFPDRLDWRAKE